MLQRAGEQRHRARDHAEADLGRQGAPPRLLDAWYRLAKGVEPSDFAGLKTTFPAVDKVGPFHVFDIGENKLRLIAFVDHR